MRIIVAAIGSLVAAGSAGAADLAARMPVKAPPPIVAVWTWTGCYIGGHAGYAWSRDRYTFTNNLGIVEDFGFNPNNGIGGAQAGCQYQAGNWVFGIEGTWSGTNLRQTDTSLLLAPNTRSIKIDQMATVVGRLGYAWDHWMVYAKGGFADLRINTSSLAPLTGLTTDATAWNGGYTVGAGVEYMATQNIVLGLEYDYAHADFNRTLNVVPAGNGISTYGNGRADVHAVLGRVSFLFNWASPVVARY